jgi:hypothetical protein
MHKGGVGNYQFFGRWHAYQGVARLEVAFAFAKHLLMQTQQSRTAYETF